MARKPTPQALALAATSKSDENIVDGGPKSAPSFSSPKSPRSPFRFVSRNQQSISSQASMQAAEPQQFRSETDLPSSPTAASLHAPTTLAVQEDPDSGRPATSPAKGGFFSQYKSSKASSRSTIRQVSEENMSRDSEQSSLSGAASASDVQQSNPGINKATTRKPVGAPPSRSDVSLVDTDSTGASDSTVTPGKKTKPKPFGNLLRTKSIRNEQDTRSPSNPQVALNPEPERQAYGPMKTAPLRAEHDRNFRDLMNSAVRNRSADRQPLPSRDRSASREHQKEFGRSQQSLSSSLRDKDKEGGGHAFFNNLKSGSTKAMSISKGFFNKVGRSGSTNEKEPAVSDEDYELKVLVLPLIQQTRKTRIAKRLEEARDKTEFWMPSFPYRAIDFLNYRGMEIEGLYRVPGSGPQVKRWQRLFDESLDIDLFEREDLYDINIICSMFKQWLRELPDEIFPKATQDKISKECAGSETVPQMLIDELSNLPPFNYYLLFAITCHLSLLMEHSDKNKMDYRNICICFQPCMKIDAFCFKFLVVDWKDCWKGCKTEDDWTEREYRELEYEMPPPSSGEGRSSTAVESHDERNISSSDSSKPSSAGVEQNQKTPQKQKPPPLPLVQTHGSSRSIDVSTNGGRIENDNTPGRDPDTSIQRLSPIEPLSPMRL